MNLRVNASFLVAILQILAEKGSGKDVRQLPGGMPGPTVSVPSVSRPASKTKPPPFERPSSHRSRKVSESLDSSLPAGMAGETLNELWSALLSVCSSPEEVA